MKGSTSLVIIEMKKIAFIKGFNTYIIKDNPDLNDSKGDEQNENEIKKTASEYQDFKHI